MTTLEPIVIKIDGHAVAVATLDLYAAHALAGINANAELLRSIGDDAAMRKENPNDRCARVALGNALACLKARNLLLYPKTPNPQNQ